MRFRYKRCRQLRRENVNDTTSVTPSGSVVRRCISDIQWFASHYHGCAVRHRLVIFENIGQSRFHGATVEPFGMTDKHFEEKFTQPLPPLGHAGLCRIDSKRIVNSFSSLHYY